MSKWDRAIEQICEGVKPTMMSKSASDYIKREDAVERVAFELMYEAAIAKGLSYKELFELEAEMQEEVKMYVQKWLEQVPSADVVEVKHGKWIDDEGQQVLMENYIDKGENWKVCSVCGAGTCIGAKYKTDKCYHHYFQSYCPNCGAKMDNAYEDVKEQENERHID